MKLHDDASSRARDNVASSARVPDETGWRSLLEPRHAILVIVVVGLLSLTAGAADRPLFDTNDVGLAPSSVPMVKPWKTVPLDPEYGGQWVVAADLDGDGEVEFVSCENHNVGDVHYTSTAVAHNLDGTVIWRWGDPDIGRKTWHHDVACQIHDWDGDGKPEVVLATKGAIVELNGQTGARSDASPLPPRPPTASPLRTWPVEAGPPTSSSRTGTTISTPTMLRANRSGT